MSQYEEGGVFKVISLNKRKISRPIRWGELEQQGIFLLIRLQPVTVKLSRRNVITCYQVLEPNKL